EQPAAAYARVLLHAKESCLRGRITREHLQYTNTDDALAAHEVVGNLFEAQHGSHFLAVLQQLRNHLLDGVYRYGEADAGAGATGADDLRVHADQLAQGIEQGAAGVARVDRGIGLDYIADGTIGHRGDLAAQCAHHAHSHGGIEAEGIAYGDDLAAHFELR